MTWSEMKEKWPFDKKIWGPGACIIRLITAVIYEWAIVFVPGKPFQPSLVFVGIAPALPGTNTLAYYGNP